MKTVYCYQLTDRRGTKREVVATHDEETVTVEGLRCPECGKVVFESSANDLEGWADEHGLGYQQFEVRIDFAKREARVT